MPGTKSNNPFRPRSHRYALEPRQMYDGAALVEAAHHADPAEAAHDAGKFHSAATDQPGHAVQPAAPAPAPTAAPAPAPAAPAEAQGKEVYVVDESVANWQSLVAQLPKGSQVVVIDDTSSGMDQLANALRGEHDISAIHIISHGSSDSMSLGTDTVTAANIDSFARQLGDVGHALTADGDILLYGCDVSSKDTMLVTEMAKLTSADVASSTDETGAAERGGNWVLESRTGTIEARSLALNYDGLLEAPTVDTTTKAITAAEPSPLNATGADRATLSGWTITDSGQVTVLAVVGDASKGSLLDASGNGAVSGAGFSFTGSAADAAAWLNQLQFAAKDVELGNTAAKTTIDVTVTDVASSLTASKSQDVTITPSNDPVSVADATQDVAEVDGGTGTVITKETLAAQDPEVDAGTQTPTQIVYSVTGIPAYGYLTLDGNRLGVGSVFTQQDVIGGKVRYVHTATGADQDHLDGFDLRVNDGATPLASSDTVHITLNVVPENQAPTVGGEGSVYEGQPANAVDTGHVGQYIVASSGGDPQDTSLVITITALPTHGTLFYNGVAVKVGDSFDYAQRNGLTYSNDGDDFITQDTFGVRVTDQGGGTDTPASSDGTVTLHIQAVDDDPALVEASTRDATVTQAGTGDAGAYTVELTAAMIGATDIDSPDSNISFVTSQAGLTHGYLLLNGQRMADGAVFTLADITGGRVQYVQYAGATAGQVDTFNFQVVDNTTALRWNADGTTFTREGGDYTSGLQTATLKNYTFTIHLAQTQAGNTGGFPLVNPPVHETASNHAGTDPSNDQIGTLVEGGNVLLHGTTTNGQPTDFSKDPGLSYTVDGVPSSQVVYTFLGFDTDAGTSGGGTLQKLVAGAWVDIATYGTFTQADLDAGNVRFQHDGGENFHVAANFSVSAGITVIQNGVATADVWRPTLDIYTTPVNDLPVVSGSSSTVIGEGETAMITTGQLSITDPDDATSQVYLENSATLPNGDKNYAYNNAATGNEALKFIVTTLPTGGTLQYSTDHGASWHDVVVGDELDASIITGDATTTGLRFVSNGSEVRSTSFTVEAVDRWGDHSATTGTVGIQITNVNDAPVIAKDPTQLDPTAPSDSPNHIGGAAANNPLTVKEGGWGQITTAMLQAYDPDSTNVQVQYLITSAPAHGSIAYSTDGVNFHILGAGSSFTQKDVADGYIYYLNDGTESTGVTYSGTPDDKFGFTISDGDKEQAGNSFWIYTTPTNDAPTVTAPTGPIDLDSSQAANNQVPGFSVGDPDLTTLTGTEKNYMEVVVRLLHSDGTAFGAAEYSDVSIGYGAGATVDADKNGVGDYLVLRGTREQVNAALAALTVTFSTDRDAKYQVQVIADDRLRNDSGALIGGANGGPENQSATPGTGNGPATEPVDATEYDWYAKAVPTDNGNISAAAVTVRASSVNDKGVLTGPATVTTKEDQATYIGGSFVVSDAESAAFGTPVTVTLHVDAGSLGIGGSGAQTSLNGVTITGDNTGDLVLTGLASDIQALLNDATLGLTYTSARDANHDQNGTDAGDVTLTVKFDDSGSKIGDDTGNGSVANNPADLAIAITIDPVNDAPTVGVSDGSVVYLNGVTDVGGFSVGDIDITGDGIATGETDFVQVTVRITDAAGTALAQSLYGDITIGSSATGTNVTVDGTYTGTHAALVIRGTRDQVNAYLAGLQVAISGDLANDDKGYHVEVIADDRLRNLTTGALDGSNNANGGPDANADNTGVANVPSDPVDPYAAVPGGLDQNVATNSRAVFPSSINNPTAIGVTGSNTYTEIASGVYTLQHITLADPDAGTAGISATVVLPTGFSVHDVNGVAGSSGDVGNAHWVVGTDSSGHATVTFTGSITDVQAALNTVGIKTPAASPGDNNALWNGTFQVQLVVSDNGNHGGRPSQGTLTQDQLANETADPTTKGDQYGYADGSSNVLVTTRVVDVTISSVAQVKESGLVNGDSSQVVTGMETFVLVNDLDSVTIGDPAAGAGNYVTLTLAQLQDLNNVPEAQRTIQTAQGMLVVTGYLSNGASQGMLAYRYTLNGAVNQPGAASSTDVVAISTRDSAGFTDNGTITVTIVDDTPTARADTGDVVEDSGTPLTGNVVSGTTGGDVADRVGADATTTPVTGVKSGTGGAAPTTGVGTTVAGQYGSLVMHADGSYTYTLNDDNAAVNALKDNQTLTETYTYAITDKDGDRSTTTLKITIHGHTDGTPSIVPVDGNGATAGHATVHESGLTDTSGSQVATGTITVTAADGVASVTIGDTSAGAGHYITLTAAQMAALGTTSKTITTPDGTLVLDGYTPGTAVGGVPTAGAIHYTYTLNHTVTAAGAETTDPIALSVTDRGGVTVASGNLVVDIIDDAPTARADTGSVNEDGAALSGNVVTGTTGGSVADRLGADTTATPVTGVAAGTPGADVTGHVGSGVTGQYGTLVLNADGTYTYTVDNTNATVNAMKDGDSLTDAYTYTITDADGDTSTTTLTITIHGHTDGSPAVVSKDNNGAAAGDATVYEAGLVDQPGTDSTSGGITVSAPDGINSVSFMFGGYGFTFTQADLKALANHTASYGIGTAYGTITITGFDVTDSVGGVPTEGTLRYTYQLLDAPHVAGTDTTQAYQVAVTDVAGNTSPTVDFVVDVVDDVPTAHADTGDVTEDSGTALTGNVVSGSTHGDAPDRIGADATSAPVTGVKVGTSAGAAAGNVGTALAGQYGTLTLNADGSYSYALDDANANVNALKTGDTLTETYTYTITDSDGDASTTTLTITIHGHTDGAPSIVPVDTNGATAGHATVHESGLTDTSGDETTTGTITVTAADGLDAVTIGDTSAGTGHYATLTAAQLATLGTTPVTIQTPDGTLVLTGFATTASVGGVPTAGTISYSYTLDHTMTVAGTDTTDSIALSVTDRGGSTVAASNLVVDIVDDAPTAHADTGDVTEDGTALTGNVVSGTTGGDMADRIGADTTSSPVTGVEAGAAAGAAVGHVGSMVAGQYGALTLNADGSYAYVVDNANATVNALKMGDTLTDTYTYTITDADGDTSTATLTITIHGHTDGTPSIVPVDGNGATAGHATVLESGLTDTSGDEATTGTITVTAADGLDSVTIGDTAAGAGHYVTLTAAQLATLGTTPVTVQTPDGTLVLTGFTATASVGGVPTAGTISYSYTLDHTMTVAGTDTTDSIALSVTDRGGSTVAASNLVIDIVDDAPTAHADTGDVNEDGAALTGNVVSGTTGGDVADRIGADTTSMPVTGVKSGTTGGAPTTGVGATVGGQYGSLVMTASGSYTYTVDNTNATVNALKAGDTLTDTYTYTITDADGDSSTTTLTITIHGHTDGTPSIVPVDGNGATVGHATVHESGLTDTSGDEATTGTITVTAADGLDSVTIGDTAAGAGHYVTLTAAQLATLGTTPVTIQTPDGTLVLTGFTATASVGGVPTAGTISYSYTLDHTMTVAGTDTTDSIALSVTDRGGSTVAASNLVIDIVDDAPTAHADTGDVTEDGTALTGNVVSGTTGGDVADRIGADTTSMPVTGVKSGTTGGAPTTGVGATVGGQYGSLVMTASGSYTYTVDNMNATVNALKAGDTLTETYTYTITDADGDTSTTTLTITIHGHTDGTPSIVPVDGNGATAGHATVLESGLTDTSGDEATTGTITVTAADGLDSVTIGDTAAGAGHYVTLTAAQLATLGTTPVTIQTPDGTLVLTGFTATASVGGVPTAGTISYSYTLDHTMTVAGTDTTDSIALSVTDRGGSTVAASNLVIDIVDDAPTARADTGDVTEDSGVPVTGHVVSGSAHGDVPDRIGADTTSTPVTGVQAGTASGAVSGHVGTGVAGQYGTLTLDTDGSYSYALDNANANVNALKAGDTLTEAYTYTITDADGDTSTTTLTITIHGHTDGTPSIVPVDGNGATAGHATVHESGLTDTSGDDSTTGTIDVVAADGLDSVTIGGTPVTAAQLAGLGTTPVTIHTPDGTLVLTGFTATTSVGGVPVAGTISYSYTLDHTMTVAGTDTTDSIALSVTDRGGTTVAATNLVIDIVDDAPTAHADTGDVTEDSGVPLTGHVVSGNAHGDVPDRLGADTTPVPVTAVSVDATAGNIVGTVGTSLAGNYGSLVLNSDGSYSYALDNTNPTVNALKDGDTLTETYHYTITDADGDSSSTTLTITIHGHTDGSPTFGPHPGHGTNTTGGDVAVWEAGLTTDGPAGESKSITDTLDISTPDGLVGITVGGTTLTAADLAALDPAHPVTITTADGSTLLLTGFTPSGMLGTVPTGGSLSYTYTLGGTHDQAGSDHINDTLALSVDDAGGATTTGTLVVTIMNDVPTARADHADVNEDGAAATGNVIGGGAGGDVPDRIGADTNPLPVTGVQAGHASGAVSGHVGSGVAGQYGTLVLNADGSYRYAVDNANPVVNALKAGDTLTETYTYTITDGDGDRSSTTLTITIHGHTDGVPSIAAVDGNGATTGHATVHESGLADGDHSQVTTGTIDVSAEDGLASVTIGGTTLTPAQLDALNSGTPVTIHTPDGTLLLTGFQQTAANGTTPTAGTISYTYTLDHPVTQHGADSSDNIALTVVDRGGGTSSGMLVVDIANDVPTARDDSATIVQDRGQSSAAGNVFTGSDRIGADGAAAGGPVTAVVSQNTGRGGSIGAGSVGAFGTLVLNADGGYSYTLDRTNPKVASLDANATITEVFVYTITDADGDTSTATLTITIHGTTPPIQAKQGDEIWPIGYDHTQRDIRQAWEPGLFVLPDGVAFSHKVLEDIDAQRRVGDSDFARDHSPLWDDFSPFAPAKQAERDEARDKHHHQPHEKDHAKHAAPKAPQHASHEPPQVPVAIHVPPPASTPGGAPSLSARIAAMAKANHPVIAAVPTTQPRH